MSCLAALAVLFATAIALAETRVQFLAGRLKSDDFRVRTSAVLALGQTDSDDAVMPLCGALADSSETVRQAAAVSLKNLKRCASTECLRQRSGAEERASVKLQIQRALEAIDAAGCEAGSSSAPPPNVARAKYYVSMSPVANKTTRSQGEVDRVVGSAVKTKLAQLAEYQMAPAGESNSAAKAVIAKRALKGFYLAVSVEAFDYSEGNLRVQIKIAVFSYPGRDLKGEVPAGATLPGARPGDTGAEDRLMSVVAARAAELFAQNFR